MSALTQIANRVISSGRTAGRTRTGGTGMGRTGMGRTGMRGTAGGTGRRTQDEAVGRGVRSLLRKVR